MKSETERLEPKLPCPRCGELTPSDSRYCSACGAEIYAACPDCGTPRGAVDAFCRKCGFNFSRKKLQLKTPAPAAGPDSAKPLPDILPQAQFQKSGKRSRYQMSPVGGMLRAVVMLAVLIALAGAIFWGVYRGWDTLSRQGMGMWEKFRQDPFALLKPAAAPETAVEPDWNARYQYWVGYYQDVFTPPPTNVWVEVRTATGIREKGLLLQIAEDSVRLKKENQELGFPRVLLDRETRQIFFAEDYASAAAAARVEAEKAEWTKQAGHSSTGSRDSAVSGGSPASAAPPAARTFLDIKCHLCSGKGLILEQRGKSSVTKPCPVCGGKGFRRFERAPDFPWPAGALRCGKCQGMGIVWSRSPLAINQGGYITCPLCGKRGFVVDPWAAAQNVPPRYE